MRKLVFIVFLCIFSLSLTASDGIIILNDAKDCNIVPLESYSLNRIELNAISSNIAYSLVEENGLLFAELKFNNGSIIGDYGAPKLPAFYKLIVIPENADYEVYYTKGSYIDIDLLAETGADLIYPIQQPVPKSGEQEIEFQMDSDIYFEDAVYPEVMTTVHEEMRGRGIRLLPISITPAEYNPVTGNLRVYTEISIEVRLSNADMRATRKNYDRYLSTYSDIYINSSLGFEELNDQIGSREPYYHGEGLLIITADEFSAGMQDFIEWKEIKGYRVTDTLISEIPNSNTTAGIKAYIQNAYDNWDIPPSHIILVGGANHIPTFTGPVSNSASDQFYVFLDGDDYFPDAAISRFTVLNENQLNTYLNKIMYYEEFGNSDLSWMTDAALISGEDFGWYEVGEGTLNYAVDNYLDPLGWDYDKLYRHTYDATKAEVIASMNAGKMIANFTAHCGPQTWAFRSGQYIVNADIHALTNQDMYFYAIGNCCTSATFDTTTETIGEAFIVADNAAIAYWGASNSTYWGPDDILAKRSYDAFFEEGIQLLAPNSDYSKVQLWLHYGGDTHSQRYMEYYLVFGDGTTFIPRVSPTEMNVNAPVLVPSGSTDMAVSVASAKGPVNNALVSAWMPDLNVRGIARTDSAGNAVIDFDNPVTIPGEFLLTVTHPDHINNSSMIMVGTSSEGYVSFNRDLYNCTDEVEIMLMDEDLAGLGTYTLDIYSTTDPAGIQVDLTETEFDGVFQGSFFLTSDLAVSHDDTITVEYFDADTGDGSGALITDTALIDCMGPEFFNIDIISIAGNSASITFETDENAVTSFNYGTDPDNLNMTQTVSTSYGTTHTGTISGLDPDTNYYFEIIGADIVHNENTSAVFNFRTLNIMDVGDGTHEISQAPLYCFYNINRTQVIYHAEDLGNNQLLINSLAFEVTQVPVLTLNNWTIRMKHTNKDDHSGGEGFETEDWNIVYQNDENINETGWIIFELDEPFYYDGIQNLMIDFSFYNSNWQNPSGSVKWSQADESRTARAYNDTGGDPLIWSGTGIQNYATENYYINLQLGLENIDPEPDGTVRFDKDYYGCDSEVKITVRDSNVGEDFVFITIISTSDEEGWEGNLSETEFGIFEGTITLGIDVNVEHGDILTVTYLDEDIGDGTQEEKTDTAIIDCLPEAPSDLTANTITNEQIDLSWTDNSDNENGFTVERRLGIDGSWEDIATLSQNTEEYSDTDVEPNNLYFYRVYAFNDSGNSPYSNEASAHTLTLADALNNTELEWTTDGNAEWFPQTDEFHYGGSSAQSGPITHSQSSSLHTTIEGPGELSFYWKVSSENNYDWLRFYINGTQQNQISGEQSWHQMTYDIPPGNHALTWTYIKDHSVSAGQDTGWVDLVEYEQFELEESSVTLLVDPDTISNDADPQGAGDYYTFDDVDISVQAVSGYAFIGWTGTHAHLLDDSSSMSTSFIMPDHDVEFTAVYEESFPPDAPSDLLAVAISETQIDLSWTDNSDDEEGFKIERRTGESGSWSQIAETGANIESYSDTGLEEGTLYYYRVRAFNDAGNSPYSNNAYATTHSEDIESVSVFRFFNTLSGGHLYTVSELERDYIIDNLPEWDYEGISFEVYLEPVSDTTEAYRFFNTQTGIHLYTISEHERDHIIDNLPEWNYEGISFNVYEDPGADSIPVFRFFNTARGGHLYTISEYERDYIIDNLPEWNYEGIAFYVLSLEKMKSLFINNLNN